MTAVRDTTLTPEQHARLNDIAYNDPAARVIAWFEHQTYTLRTGPVIRKYDHRTVCVSRGGRIFEIIATDTPAARTMHKRQLEARAPMAAGSAR